MHSYWPILRSRILIRKVWWGNYENRNFYEYFDIFCVGIYVRMEKYFFIYIIGFRLNLFSQIFFSVFIWVDLFLVKFWKAKLLYLREERPILVFFFRLCKLKNWNVIIILHSFRHSRDGRNVSIWSNIGGPFYKIPIADIRRVLVKK